MEGKRVLRGIGGVKRVGGGVSEAFRSFVAVVRETRYPRKACSALSPRSQYLTPFLLGKRAFITLERE